MKKHSFIKAAAVLLLSSVTVMSLMTSCEGPQGIAGLNGKDGKDGIDANANCTQCHNSGSVLIAKISQASHSKHQTGTTSFENATNCAICHTSQGFIERTARDTFGTRAVVTDPSAINCRTCHTIHTNYDSTDFALRADGPVKLMAVTGNLDLGSGNNTCANCHQSRPISPMPVIGGANVSITSSRWGTHHGPQSTVLAGLVGYKVAGSVAYPTSAHPHQAAGCVTCHMANAVGSVTGGHSFNMTDVDEGDNLASCKTCHSTLTTFDYQNTQTDVAALLDQLQTILIDKGYLNSSTLLWKATSGAPLNLTADEAGTLLNYSLIKEDKSMGIHNPPFVKALLQNSIDFWAAK